MKTILTLFFVCAAMIAGAQTPAPQLIGSTKIPVRSPGMLDVDSISRCWGDADTPTVNASFPGYAMKGRTGWAGGLGWLHNGTKWLLATPIIPALPPAVMGGNYQVLYGTGSGYTSSSAFNFNPAKSGLIVGGASADSIGLYSAAFGPAGTSANGAYAFAFGSANRSPSNFSFTFGVGNVAPGILSVAWGQNCYSGGDFAFNFGRNSTNMGIRSFAAGPGNSITAAGQYGIAIGNSNSVTALGGISIGWVNQANGILSTSLGGRANNAIGDGAGIWGAEYSNGRGYYSAAFGSYVETQSANEVAWGQNNIIYTPYGVNTWDNRDLIWAVGGGLTDGNTPPQLHTNLVSMFKNGHSQWGRHTTIQDKGGFNIAGRVILDTAGKKSARARIFAGADGSIYAENDSVNVIITGHSILSGYGGTGITNIFKQRLGPKFIITNTAVDGHTLAYTINEVGTNVTPNINPRMRNIVISMDGASFGVEDSLTLNQYNDRLKGYIASLKAVGVDMVFWISNIPSDFHPERNINYRTNAQNQWLRDSLFIATGAYLADLGGTRMGLYGNVQQYGSAYADYGRSSFDVGLYPDLTHPSPRGADIIATLTSDKVFNVLYGSAMPDRTQYNAPQATAGTYIIWGANSYPLYDSLLGGYFSCCTGEQIRGTSAQHIDSTSSNFWGALEWQTQSAAVYIGFRHRRPDTTYKHDSLDYQLYANGNGTMDFYIGGAFVTSVANWSAGDVFRLEVYENAIRVIKNASRVYTYATAPAAPLYAAFSAGGAHNQFKEMKISNGQTCPLTNQDLEITDIGKGIILKSPDGTRWRTTISDAGVIQSVPVN